MTFPFVSRERFEEQRKDLEQVRAELKRLNNWIVWRVGGGVAPDSSLLPEAYQPKVATNVAKANSEEDDDVHSTARGPGQARRTLGQFERDRQVEYEKTTLIPSGQLGVMERMNNAANEGVKDASN